MLAKIIADKKIQLSGFDTCLESIALSDRDFLAAITAKKRSIIAELKPCSPSHGALTQQYDPHRLAQQYTRGGAAALSVLTDEKYFHGHLNHLTLARSATDLPILCKDFILEEKQVYAARHAGADACLLILAALDDKTTRQLKSLIESLNMLAVLETHTPTELARALAMNPKVILINHRNLFDLAMHPTTTEKLLPYIPENIPVISASGFSSLNEINALPTRVQCVLIGASLMRANDPTQFLRELTGGHDEN